MKSPVRYMLYGLLWLAAGAVLFVGLQRASHVERERVVTGLEIEIADSSSHGLLITSSMVRGWLKNEKLNLEGMTAREVNLQAIEEIVARNGFVGSVRASIDYNGLLHISIRQRQPLFRLLLDGYNHYVTESGYLFRAPESSSLCVPVVTGPLKPPFAPSFEGELKEHREASRRAAEERILALEPEKYPFYEREKENREYHRETRRMFTRRGLLESEERFEERVKELRAYKQRRRRHYRYVQQQLEAGIARVEAKQNLVAQEQKKLEKNYEDFQNLITFVKRIDNDPFWRSEVVQIIASEAHSGALEVAFVPRSGAVVVELGRLEQVEEKLDRLEHFRKEGLSQLGWEHFRTISLKYDDCIVGTPKREIIEK